MARSYLQSTLLSTLPSFATEWKAHRDAYPPGTQPRDEDFLALFRTHIVSLLQDGRVAEASRFFYALERLLTDADPILRDLLARDLVGALSRECTMAMIDARRVEPYLGSRTRSAWTSSIGDRRDDS